MEAGVSTTPPPQCNLGVGVSLAVLRFRLHLSDTSAVPKRAVDLGTILNAGFALPMRAKGRPAGAIWVVERHC